MIKNNKTLYIVANSNNDASRVASILVKNKALGAINLL
jgi:hypothetical protein